MTYTLHLTESDFDTIDFVGHRYSWADALGGLDIGENVLDFADARAIAEAIEEDMEGGHDAFPMLDTRSELCDKLVTFYREVME